MAVSRASAVEYARGSRAWGVCDRSGMRMPVDELIRDTDGLMVCREMLSPVAKALLKPMPRATPEMARDYARRSWPTSQWEKVFAMADTVQDARVELHGLFAAATVTEWKVQTDLCVAAVEEAIKTVGSGALLIYAPPNHKTAMLILQDGLVGETRIEDGGVLGSPYAWAMISKDGKRAIVGMRDGR